MNTSKVINATVCTILTVPRTNVFNFNITTFPNPNGGILLSSYLPSLSPPSPLLPSFVFYDPSSSIYFVTLTRNVQTTPPTYVWPPMSYPSSPTGPTSLPGIYILLYIFFYISYIYIYIYIIYIYIYKCIYFIFLYHTVNFYIPSLKYLFKFLKFTNSFLFFFFFFSPLFLFLFHIY